MYDEVCVIFKPQPLKNAPKIAEFMQPPHHPLLLSSPALGQPVTFNVLVEGEMLSIKEKTLSVPKNDKGAIVLRFVPIDKPKEETILVKLEEQSTGIQHTVKINATWS